MLQWQIESCSGLLYFAVRAASQRVSSMHTEYACAFHITVHVSAKTSRNQTQADSVQGSEECRAPLMGCVGMVGELLHGKGCGPISRIVWHARKNGIRNQSCSSRLACLYLLKFITVLAFQASTSADCLMLECQVDATECFDSFQLRKSMKGFPVLQSHRSNLI